jgi:hypothetical protein
MLTSLEFFLIPEIKHAFNQCSRMAGTLQRRPELALLQLGNDLLAHFSSDDVVIVCYGVHHRVKCRHKNTEQGENEGKAQRISSTWSAWIREELLPFTTAVVGYCKSSWSLWCRRPSRRLSKWRLKMGRTKPIPTLHSVTAGKNWLQGGGSPMGI